MMIHITKQCRSHRPRITNSQQQLSAMEIMHDHPELAHSDRRELQTGCREAVIGKK
jgi:hypothetical protein